jgi:hypothetical protein
LYPNRSHPPGQPGTRRLSPRKPVDPRGTSANSKFPPIRATDLPADILLARLHGVRGYGPTYSACCPAHGDTRPSLSITERDDHTLLVYCHAGCNIDAIMEAVDLDLSYLFPSPFALKSGKPTARTGLAQRGTAGRDPVTGEVMGHEYFEAILKKGREGAESALDELARALGLPVKSLQSLHIGFLGGRWVFPERDDQGRLVGILYRHSDGRKYCESGSRRGLTIPVHFPMFAGPLFVIEGATDCAALHACGAAAVGRPAAPAAGLVSVWLTRMLQRFEEREIIVVGDNDPEHNGRATGRHAARNLAVLLRNKLGRPISWALPPLPHKDVREQVIAGEWARGLIIEEAH